MANYTTENDELSHFGESRKMCEYQRSGNDATPQHHTAAIVDRESTSSLEFVTVTI